MVLNPNSHAYRNERNLLVFGLSFNLLTKHSFITRVNTKSDYINKRLTNNIKSKFDSKKQMKFLRNYAEKLRRIRLPNFKN